MASGDKADGNDVHTLGNAEELEKMEALLASLNDMMGQLQTAVERDRELASTQAAQMAAARETWRSTHQHECEPDISPNLADLAAYKSIVYSPGISLSTLPGKGRVLVAERDLPATTLLLVERCLAQIPQEKCPEEVSARLGAFLNGWALSHALGQLPAHRLALLRQMGNAHRQESAALEETLQTLRNLGFDPAPSYPVEDIAEWIGICTTNAFESKAKDGSMSLFFYLMAAMPSHSCCPNTELFIEDGWLYLHADADIAAGEEVTISYINRFQPTEQRQSLLLQKYGFVCACAQCAGNAESGEHTESNESGQA